MQELGEHAHSGESRDYTAQYLSLFQAGSCIIDSNGLHSTPLLFMADLDIHVLQACCGEGDSFIASLLW